jgi:hypothetical protein
VVQREIVNSAQQYDRWAAQRKGEYEAATKKFLDNKDLAPFYPVAEAYFTQLNLKSGQQIPVAQLFDMTVEHIETLRRTGIQPPRRQEVARGGFSPGGQPWDVPDVDGNPRQAGGIRNQDPEEVLARKREYLADRRRDFEMRRDRSTPLEEIDARHKSAMDNLRSQSSSSGMSFQKG